MRTQSSLHRWWLPSKVGWVVLAGAINSASAQNAGQQVLKLPNPTPRELTPELRYKDNSAAAPAGQKLQAAQNERRWQLILWAADELVVLSERAEKAAQSPPGDASKRELEGNVGKIESVAKNLGTALKAH